jgi:hypothetical protein
MGYLYLSRRKTSRWQRVPGYSGYMSGYSGHQGPETPDQRVSQTGNSNPETPGIRPDTPDSLSGHSGLGSEFHRKSLFNGRIVSHGFCRFS